MAVQRAIITRFDAGCTHNIEDPYENLIFSMKFGPSQYPQNYEALTTIKRWRRLRTLYSGNLRKNQFKKQLSGTVEINLTSDIIKHNTKRLKTLEIVFLIHNCFRIHKYKKVQKLPSCPLMLCMFFEIFLIMSVQRAIITRFYSGCTHILEDTYENLISSMGFDPKQYP